MSSTKENEINPNAMYRFNPDLGYVEMKSNQTEQNQVQNPMQNQANFAYANNPYFVPPMYQQNTQYAPYAYCPPFMHPHMMMYNQMYNNAMYNSEMQQAQATDPYKMQEEFEKYMHKMQEEQAKGANAQQGLTQEKMQEIYNAVNDAINGNPDPNKLFGILQGTSNDFWKGLAIGAGAVLLFNYTPLKTMFASMLGSFGASQAEQATEASETCDCENSENE